ncbi:MAG: hypothetical protein WA688_02775 [Thermoplasmata archaeon]
MPFRIDSIDDADAEFLSLPPAVREVFIAAFRELAASNAPVLRGNGWHTEELRQNQRIAHGGLFSVHVGALWRGAFFRDRDALVFIGFGFRVPEFYDKLARLRKSLDGRTQ